MEWGRGVVAQPVNSVTSAIGEGSDRLEVMCEIRRTSQRKLASLDNTYQVVFETSDPKLLELGFLPSDTLVKLIVEVVSG